MIDIIMGYIQSIATVIGIVLMIYVSRKFVKSGIRTLVLDIALAYLTFGLASYSRVIINIIIGSEEFTSQVYQTVIILSYGLILSSLAFLVRLIHHIHLLAEGFGDINYARMKRAEKKKAKVRQK